MFQKHLCKNAAELMKEENVENVSVPEAYLGHYQLSMMNVYSKID